MAILTSSATAESLLQPGAYEVEVRLELPNLAWSAVSSATICLPAPDDGPPLPVLSANNPLARCPAENVRREGATLRFDIVCPGINAARAHAVYDLFPARFEGRIAMTMGGKNMTMTEVQIGRRVAGCDSPELSAPPRRRCRAAAEKKKLSRPLVLKRASTWQLTDK